MATITGIDLTLEPRGKKMKNPAVRSRSTLVFGLIALSLIASAHAQAGEPNGDSAEEKSFADLVQESSRAEGFFDLYRNPDSGDMYIGIDADQIDQPFIHAVFVVDSPVEAGLYRGAGVQKMLRVRRHFGRLEFINESTAFFHDPDSPLSRAAGAHATPSTLAVAEILAEDEATGTLLIDGKQLFLSEALQQIKPTLPPDFDPKTAFALGELDPDRSKIYEARSYPQNTNWFVDYVFANPAPAVPANDEVPDSRAVSIKIQHSFVQAPDDGYEPRLDDYRVGYFASEITDLTSDSHTPYLDVIRRWDLRKSDPSMPVSDVVEPLVWWIENTTPLEWRDLIRDATLLWNEAFEKAGLRNAIEVRVQPDDADWDAGDIRYNVLRWAASPQPPYGGIGPSFIDPRTGQILGSDISLEYSFVTNRMRALELYDPSSRDVAQASASGFSRDDHCAFGNSIQSQLILGRALLDLQGASPRLHDQMVRDALTALILHEVGHTLGLMHNMKATQLLSPDEMADPAVMDSGVIDASVMDYAPVHFAATEAEQTLFYSVRPGQYDEWAIQFGYDPELRLATARAEHLALSTRPALMFGNDADDMRSPGAGIDPRVMINDHSSDAITYASNRMVLLGDALKELEERVDPNKHGSYQVLADAFSVAGVEYRNSASVVSRYIGGVYVNRAAPGQEGATQPYQAVPLEEQKRAMKVLREQVFAADAFPLEPSVIGHLQPQRRGFDFFQKTEDPKIHELFFAVHTSALDHLLHPVVLKRLTDSRLYGNEYSVDMMLGDLSAAIFADDSRDDVVTLRQNLQLEYVNRLLGIVESGSDATQPSSFDAPSRAAALQQLQQIDEWSSNARNVDNETVAHRKHIRYQIASRLDLD
jgi:hypothetical protein